MAALASSLIRQKRAVKDDQANRPVANKRKPCPKSNKSLCQKQILVLISKVRLCGGRKGRNEKRPGEWQLSGSIFLRWHLFFSLRCWNESWTNVCFYLFYENGVFTFSQGIKHKKKNTPFIRKTVEFVDTLSRFPTVRVLRQYRITSTLIRFEEGIFRLPGCFISHDSGLFYFLCSWSYGSTLYLSIRDGESPAWQLVFNVCLPEIHSCQCNICCLHSS